MKTLWQTMTTIVLAVAASSGPAEQWNFEDAQIGRLPKGWSAAKTGEGPGSTWKVIEDKSAPKGPKVLAQVSSEGPRRLFNLCVAEKTSYADLDLTVAFKAVQGKIDQGGGPVWRYQDKDNYYIARMNPLECNFRFYKVIKGKRTQLASSDFQCNEDSDLKATLTGKWHTIRIVHRGDRICCYLNGKPLLEATDGNIRKPGRIGLWTKADAVTSFDALSAKALSD